MYQRDYILRMIEMLAQLIAAILKYIKSGDLSKASQSLQSAYSMVFHDEVPKLRSLPEEGMIDTLLQEYLYTNGHLEMLAELFYADAELLLAEKKIPESLSYYRKSLTLLEYIDKEYKSYSRERQDRIMAVRERLKDDSLKT
ncbi:MAG: hypothetical protein JXR41_08875 [Bacteroidales bacterium]|nr:hypothetical protein [Bacteroidales bacterium]MBN2763188.1 hypothetical protein [Bacteroidales bacterium]